MLTIIRKSDNQPCGTISSNMNAEQEIIKNVIPNFGGVPEDYEVQNIEIQSTQLQTPEPTVIDYLIDIDFRLCMIELGLN